MQPASKDVCMDRGKKFVKYSPGCGGRAEHPSGLLCLGQRSKDGKVSHPNCGGFTRRHVVPGKTCSIHYLESHFGLYALKCPKCWDRIQEETDVHMDEDERYTWVSIDRFFVPPRFGWFRFGGAAFEIRCWFCGFLLQRKSRWRPTRDYMQKYVQVRAWQESVKGLDEARPEWIE